MEGVPTDFLSSSPVPPPDEETLPIPPSPTVDNTVISTETILLTEVDCTGQLKVVSTTEISKTKGLIPRRNIDPEEEIFSYPCYRCGDRLESLEELEGHIKEYHGNGRTPENGVDKDKWRPRFIIHMGRGRTPPPDYKEFPCPKCGILAPSEEKLEEHVQQEHPTKPKVSCPICSKLFSRQWELNIHIKHVHDNNRDHLCPEPTCTFATSDRNRLTKHTRQVHDPFPGDTTRLFPCTQCPYTTKKKSSLEAHVNAVHLQLKPFSCSMCEYKAAQSGQMQKHVAAKHTKAKPHKCRWCDYRAVDGTSVRRHERVRHEGRREYLCAECGYASGTKSQLEGHVRKKHVERKRRRTKPIMVKGYRIKTDL